MKNETYKKLLNKIVHVCSFLKILVNNVDLVTVGVEHAFLASAFELAQAKARRQHEKREEREQRAYGKK